MRYSVSVYTHAAFGSAIAPRLLVPEPYRFATLKAARAWLSRMAATWIGALFDGEDGFSGCVLDEDGSEALTVEYGRDPDAEPIEHDRASLREMKAHRPKKTITTTAGGTT
jgi:hypothetical protein